MGGDGGLRALSVVRGVAGGVRHGAVVWGCGAGAGLGGAQAEDGPAGRGASAGTVAPGSVSADLGAEPGGAGCAAVAGASAQAGAGADAHQESAAGHGAESRGTEKVQTVDPSRTRGAGAVAAVAVRGATSPEAAGRVGRRGSGDRRTGPASWGRSAAAAGGGAVDDASGSGAGDGVGHGVDVGSGGTVRIGQAGGQLFWADSERRIQRRKTAAGQDQQTGQFVSALFAGGSGTDSGALRSAAEALLSSPGDPQKSRRGQGGRGP